MVNDIIAGISTKLFKSFGSEKRIYTDDVEQGMKEPCFCIIPVTLVQTPLLGTRKKTNVPFVIHYFPTLTNSSAELMDVCWNMTTELEFITLTNGDLLHGTDIHGEIIEGILHFFVTFTMVTVPIAAIPDNIMTDVSINVKG